MMNASKLIELLAKHINEHGDGQVLHLSANVFTYKPIVRCWYDDDKKQIRVSTV